MTLGEKKQSAADPWIASGMSLALNFVALKLAPYYATHFGDSMPSFSRMFLSHCALWIVINALALAVQIGVNLFKPDRQSTTRLQRLDNALGLISALTMVCAIIALVLPLVHAM